MVTAKVRASERLRAGDLMLRSRAEARRLEASSSSRPPVLTGAYFEAASRRLRTRAWELLKKRALLPSGCIPDLSRPRFGDHLDIIRPEFGFWQ